MITLTVFDSSLYPWFVVFNEVFTYNTSPDLNINMYDFHLKIFLYKTIDLDCYFFHLPAIPFNKIVFLIYREVNLN